MLNHIPPCMKWFFFLSNNTWLYPCCLLWSFSHTFKSEFWEFFRFFFFFWNWLQFFAQPYQNCKISLLTLKQLLIILVLWLAQCFDASIFGVILMFERVSEEYQLFSFSVTIMNANEPIYAPLERTFIFEKLSYFVCKKSLNQPRYLTTQYILLWHNVKTVIS